MCDEYLVSDISDVSDAVKIGTTMTQSWFRGHGKEVGELTPRVFRKGIHKFEHVSEELQRLSERLTGGAPQGREGREARLIDAFKRGAPSLTDNVPPPGHNAEWLFLMQHHGLPTRLLDWSESVLVAMYFAAGGERDKDGELWVMLPENLNAGNDERSVPGMPTSGNPILKYLINEPLYDEDDLLKMTRLPHPPKYPVALNPTMTFARVAAQLSTFTLHPEPGRGYTIADFLTDKKDLCRYKIPGECKDAMRKDLASLGITERSLFQDLQSLSGTLVAQLPLLARVAPEPPVFPS